LVETVSDATPIVKATNPIALIACPTTVATDPTSMATYVIAGAHKRATVDDLVKPKKDLTSEERATESRK
jgi:hypothetical protein